MKEKEKKTAKILRAQVLYCDDIVQDIIRHDASADVLKYAQKFAEIENPLLGNTDVDWVRINFDAIYVYVRKENGEYEATWHLDPEGGYGAELIIMDKASASDFAREVEEYLVHNSEKCEGDFEEPPTYVPMANPKGGK